MATFKSKFDVDDIVFIKNSHGGVMRGKVSNIGIDMREKSKAYKIIYLVWVSDRRDWAGHHVRVYENNIGSTFEEAYFDSDCMMPWNIMDDVKRKDFEQFFESN